MVNYYVILIPYVFRCPRVNVDKTVWDEKLRKTITTEYPHLENEIPAEGTRDIIDEDNENPFLLYLYDEKIQDFISYITSHTNKINCDDGKYTVLQYACHYGLPEVVEVLLDLGADPNRTIVYNSNLPICIASYRGFAGIIELFLNSGKYICYQTKNNNVLLEVVKGSNIEHGALGVNDDLCDHGRSIQLLLSVDSQYDINLVDFTGFTCLHYAAIRDNREFIFSLLDHGAYLGRKNRFGHPPLNELSFNTLELYLNKCVSLNGLSSNDVNYEIIFSYKFLCPPKMYTQNDHDDNRIRSETQDIVIENIPETTPLLYIAKISELRPLLLHPVVTKFLDLKWNKIKLYFMLNLAFFIGFLLFLTTYILLTSHMTFNDKDNTTYIHKKIFYHIWFVILGFLIVLGFRELFQFISFPISYIINIENWLEICLITLVSILLCENSIIGYVRVSVSAIVLLMSWSEMILLLGRHPMFAVRLEMFKCVSKNFAHFLLSYSFIGIAFLLSFYVLFYPKEHFDSILSTTYKMLVMAGSGEYDATRLSYENSEIIGHLLFILFVFLITLVLINLLSGVAVGDTQAIKSEADIVVLVSRINFIHSVEIMATSETHLGHSKNRFSFNISSTLTKLFFKGLKLFPEALENPKIKILPNQKNCIDFGSSTKKSSIKCFENCLGNYLDKETILKTKAIIKLNSEKPKKTVDNILQEFIEKLNSLERAVRGIKESVITDKSIETLTP